MSYNECDCLNNESQIDSILNDGATLESSIGHEDNLDANFENVVEISKNYIKRYSSKNEFPNVGDAFTLYVAVDEQSNYIWQDNKYLCIGRDYTNIEQINGGGA